MDQRITVQFPNGEARTYDKGVTLLHVSKAVAEGYPLTVVAAKVDNEIKDLQTELMEDSVVDFLDVGTDFGTRVYQRSLTFVMIIAAKELFPRGEVTVEHSLSRGLYCELHMERKLTEQDVLQLENRMRDIIAEDRAIIRKNLPMAEAIALFERSGQRENAKLLRQLKLDCVNVYYCGNVYGYFYSCMTPSTGYLQQFALTYYRPGLILRFPERERPGVLPKFVAQPQLAQIFYEAEQWGSILNCGYVAELNNYTINGDSGDIMRVAEALHEKKIAHIADFVAERRKDVRMVLIAGPSSSGKTTFARRLSIQLRVNGLRPVSISLDDYFVDRDHTPRDAQGEYDFESIETIDLALFNEHLTKLLRGEEVALPTFNFITGQREYRGSKIRVDETQPLIIEGIHGLNERLTSAIPRSRKVKIYVSALTQLSLDNYNRIPTTDARLIRRIVRDSQFRSHDALRTLQLWPAVRRGEERNIFPFQEDADMMFNSALIYELAVLKRYAEPLLEQITAERQEYPEARRLLTFLSYFEAVPEDEVFPNSILREFIGNSCFYTEEALE